MDAKSTKFPEAEGPTANIHDRATSTIIDAIEPSPPPTERPWVGGSVYAPAPPVSTTAPARFRKTRCAAPPRRSSRRGRTPAVRTLCAISTIEVLRGLEQEGFFASARAVGIADPTKTDYTSHLIRLRRLDNARQYRVGDVVCEIILRNANDGTSAYELMTGLFRIPLPDSLVARIRDN